MKEKCYKMKMNTNNRRDSLISEESTSSSRSSILSIDSYETKPRFSKFQIAGLILGSLIVTAFCVLIVNQFQCSAHLGSPKQQLIKQFTATPQHDFLAPFIKFNEKFNRDYDSVEEMVKRFAHFVGSDMAIMDLQKFSDGTIYGLTGLADKALDERGDGKEDCRDGRMLLDNMDLDWAVIDPREHPDESMPSSFDWRTKRAVTDVKDQGECRNSWVFSSIAVVESMNAIENGVLQPLSEQNVIDCELPYDRCETRTPRMALRYIQENGVSSEDDYQYFGKREKWCTNGGTELGKVFVQRVVRIPRNETLMMHYLAEVGPMTAEVPIIEPLRHYKEGVFHPSETLCAEAPSRTQTMTVVGYGTQNGKNYWILKNSWGETWGMNGYIYYERGVESCGIEEGDLFGVEVRKVPGVEAANKRSDCHDHCN